MTEDDRSKYDFSKKTSGLQRISIKSFFSLITGAVMIIVVLSAGVVWFYYKRIYISCGTQGASNLAENLAIIYTNRDIQIERMRLYFAKGSQVYYIDFSGDDWIYLYFNREKVTQLQLLNRLNNNICDLVKPLSMVVGVPFTKVVVVRAGIYPVKSSLNFLDILRWGFRVRLSAARKIMAEPTYSYTLDSGEKVKVFTHKDLASRLEDIIHLPDIVSESLYVEIFNSTSKVGYATYYARYLRLFGVNIVRVENAGVPSYLDNYDVFIYHNTRARGSKTLQLVKNVFSGKRVFFSLQRPDFILTTGDIVVILIK